MSRGGAGLSCKAILIPLSALVYNVRMKISPAAANVLLANAIARDRTTARRAALVTILQQERYLTREQLIVRVEGILCKGCFGESAWVDIFFRDMQTVKQALKADGYQLAYSRRLKQPGYYLKGQAPVSRSLIAILEGSAAEVDSSQIAILKQLTYNQRFHQGCSISNLARQVVANRIRQRNPQISLAESQRLAIRKGTS